MPRKGPPTDDHIAATNKRLAPYRITRGGLGFRVTGPGATESLHGGGADDGWGRATMHAGECLACYQAGLLAAAANLEAAAGPKGGA